MGVVLNKSVATLGQRVVIDWTKISARLHMFCWPGVDIDSCASPTTRPGKPRWGLSSKCFEELGAVAVVLSDRISTGQIDGLDHNVFAPIDVSDQFRALLSTSRPSPTSMNAFHNRRSWLSLTYVIT